MREARNLLAHSLAHSTRKSYRSAVASLQKFCQQNNLPFSFPVSADLLCLWVTHSAHSLHHRSIRVYLNGIGTMHELHGYPSPVEGESLVWRTYLGVKRLQGGEAKQTTRLPITVELLLQLERWQDVESAEGKMVRAAMWLGTCGLLRAGEFTVRDKNSMLVTRRQLSFHNEDGSSLTAFSSRIAYMQLRLDRTKTEQFGAGATIVVSQPRAVSAMTSYLKANPSAESDGPLLSLKDGRPLTYSYLIERVHSLLLSAGIDELDRYKGHSFRRGGATSLHLAGLPDSTIKVMGRWRSFTFATYVDTPRSVLLQAGRAMAGAATQGKSVTFTARQFERWTRPVWEENDALTCARPSHV